MFHKLKLRYITMSASLFVMFIVSILLLNKEGKNLFEHPLSAMGNISKNYPLFIIGSTLTILLFTYILYQIYRKNDLRVGWEIFSIPILGISSLIFPYNENNLFFKRMHTYLAVICAIMIVRVIHTYNKQIKEKTNINNKINVWIPKIAVFGTFTLFLFTGINTIIELFYFSVILFWINHVSFKH